jgi:hypothetical protein
MADNSNDKTLNNPTNTQSESPSDEIIHTKDTETINPNPGIENMEVHKHPHHVTHKKKWGEYLLEFFMLFLAVFLGFTAENIREHQVDKERERVYIKNLYDDLKSDTAIYSNYLKAGAKFSDNVDSLMRLMKSPDRNAHLSKIYFYARDITIRNYIVFPNQRTFSQLKNAGLLRLISNQNVAANISSYYLLIDEVLSQNNFIISQTSEYWKEVGNLFDAEILYRIRKENKAPDPTNLRLISNDAVSINRFLVSAQYLFGSRKKQNENVSQRSEDAKSLLTLIKKEYHLD